MKNMLKALLFACAFQIQIHALQKFRTLLPRSHNISLNARSFTKHTQIPQSPAEISSKALYIGFSCIGLTGIVYLRMKTKEIEKEIARSEAFRRGLEKIKYEEELEEAERSLRYGTDEASKAFRELTKRGVTPK